MQTQAFQVYSGVGGMGTAVLVAQIIYIFVMIYFIYRVSASASYLFILSVLD